MKKSIILPHDSKVAGAAKENFNGFKMQDNNSAAEASQGNAIPPSPFNFGFPNPEISQNHLQNQQEPNQLDPKMSPFKFANMQNPQGGNGMPNNPSDSQNSSNQNTIPTASRLTGRVTNQYYEYLPLAQAISRGDLQAVKDFLNAQPDAVTKWIDNEETPLLKACCCGQTEIVKEILRRINPEQMIIPKLNNVVSDSTDLSEPTTPLVLVAANGNFEIAEALVEKNPKLLENSGTDNLLPVVGAAVVAHEDIARYLYHKTPLTALLESDGFQATLLLRTVIFYGMLDIALDIIGSYPRLAVTRHPSIPLSPVDCLASRPELFASSSDFGFWRRFLYSCIELKLPSGAVASESSESKSPFRSLLWKILQFLPKCFGIHQLYKLKEMDWKAHKLLKVMSEEISAMDSNERSHNGVEDSFFIAVRRGNKDFLVEMIRCNSEFLWVSQNSSNSTLFLLAVQCRQEKIFNLLYGLDERRDLMIMTRNNDGDSLLHIAGMLSPEEILSKIAGAALRLQRELQWFKEVESFVPELQRELLNGQNLKPREIFDITHEPLRKEAEEWMKSAATSCSVVAALIATVTFQAVFTAPGGVNGDTGYPLRIKEARFIVFVVANIVSLFASCTSAFIFLAILTARYSLDDFLVSLPAKMIAGLSILIISVAAMLVAFSTALFTALYQTRQLVIPVLPLIGLPVTLFVLLQLPLLKEMIRSTYGKGIFDRNTKRWV